MLENQPKKWNSIRIKNEFKREKKRKKREDRTLFFTAASGATVAQEWNYSVTSGATGASRPVPVAASGVTIAASSATVATRPVPPKTALKSQKRPDLIHHKLRLTPNFVGRLSR